MSLVELGDEVFDEAKAYTIKYELYQEALRLYKYKSDKQKVRIPLITGVTLNCRVNHLIFFYFRF